MKPKKIVSAIEKFEEKIIGAQKIIDGANTKKQLVMKKYL